MNIGVILVDLLIDCFGVFVSIEIVVLFMMNIILGLFFVFGNVFILVVIYKVLI